MRKIENALCFFITSPIKEYKNKTFFHEIKK